MTHATKIEGILRLTSPMHCAAVTSEKSTSEGNVTRTQSQPMVTSKGLSRVPLFPGNDLRGRLRRKAASLIMTSMKNRGLKIGVDLYAGMNSGSISAQPDKAALTLEEVLRAKSNAYIGLFGGGSRILRSRYRVNDLLPVLKDLADVKIVPRSLLDIAPQGHTGENQVGHIAGWQAWSDRTSFRIDDVTRVMNGAEMATFIDDAVNSVADKQNSVLIGREERKSSKAAAKAGEIKKSEIPTKLDTGNMFSLEYNVPGMPMYFLLDMQDDVTDEHIGLMLLSLRDLVREQALGGWVRIGFGRFVPDLKLTHNGQTMPIFEETENLGSIELHSQVQSLVDSATNAINAMTTEELMEFFVARAKKEEVDA